MVKTLEMVFRSGSGKEVTVSVVDAKDDLTLAEVKAVMQDVVTKNIFRTKSGDLVQVVEARIRSKDTAVLA